MINVPMHQARIPIRGGGGVSRVDLTERPQVNPIVAALERIIERRRQEEQDELARQITEAELAERKQRMGLLGKPRPISELERRKAETDIAYREKATEQMGQPKPTTGKIVVGGDGKTYFVNSQTGEKMDLGIPAPKGKVKDRNITDIINDISKISSAAGKIPTESLDQTVIDEAITTLRGPLMEELGLEQVDILGEKRSRFGIDWLAKDVPARTEFRKKRPELKAPPVKDWQLQGMLTPEMRQKTPIIEALAETTKEAKEPATIKEFEAEVARLKKIDMKAAKTYYNKWVKKWQ